MKALLLGLGLTAAAVSAQADEIFRHLPADPQPHLVLHQDWLKVATNETPLDEVTTHRTIESASPASAEHDWFTANKLHKYLGLGSLGLVGLAILAPKPGEESSEVRTKSNSGGIHRDLAVGATVLGAAAVATGFAFHHKDIDLSKGFKDPDNLHMLLGTLAEVAFLTAISKAPAAGHVGEGVAGAVAMAAAIKIEW